MSATPTSAYRGLFDLDVSTYRPHPVHSAGRTYLETNCYADVVVAPDEGSARKLAAGYGLWVRSIRRGEGAIPFPGPDEASRHIWDDADRELVRDRVDTQFVGTPQTVAGQLHRLQEETGADELIVTTITHSHADRVRSFSLLAEEWFDQGSTEHCEPPRYSSP